MKKAIYKIENKINHKIYIGQSVNPAKRFKQHCNTNKYNSLITKAIEKYGENNFSLEILGWYENYNEKEKEFIQQYRSLAPYGYNILEGGQDPPHGYGESNNFAKISNETAENIKKDLLNWDIPRKQIIKKYKVTSDIVRHINDGTSWHDKDLTYPLRPTEKILNEKKADKIIELLQTTKLPHREIARLVGWSKSAVTMINIGKNHHKNNLEYPIRK